MPQFKSGHFANPAVGRMHDAAAQTKHPAPAHGKPGLKSESGEANEPNQQHSSQTHGTQPHPQTGVHAVHIHHMGGGKAMSHTHHDGGHIESQQHNSMDEAHQHAQSMLPANSGQPQAEPDGDEYALGGDDELGGMMGS